MTRIFMEPGSVQSTGHGLTEVGRAAGDRSGWLRAHSLPTTVMPPHLAARLVVVCNSAAGASAASAGAFSSTGRELNQRATKMIEANSGGANGRPKAKAWPWSKRDTIMTGKDAITGAYNKLVGRGERAGRPYGNNHNPLSKKGFKALEQKASRAVNRFDNMVHKKADAAGKKLNAFVKDVSKIDPRKEFENRVAAPVKKNVDAVKSKVDAAKNKVVAPVKKQLAKVAPNLTKLATSPAAKKVVKKIPGISIAFGAYDMSKSIKEGNYSKATLQGLNTALGATPVGWADLATGGMISDMVVEGLPTASDKAAKGDYGVHMQWLTQDNHSPIKVAGDGIANVLWSAGVGH